ncbi:ATP-binding protein [Fannyhessea vaginae]|uniref:ATP-binding protein n=1 Tax=Fannyhessea vaginae TaxID=82135 RepID=UPI003A7FD958
MMIDQFYSSIDKNNFYLGMVSQVYKDTCVVQIENFTWLNQRRINQELLIPNTINYHVLIDSIYGLFIGEVYQAKIQSAQNTHYAVQNESVEKVFPELFVDLIGVLPPDGESFNTPGFYSVGLMDKVYITNQKINKTYLNSIEVSRLDDDYWKDRLSSFATAMDLGNEEISLYPESLFDRHLMAIGTTNSGKSTSSLSILDKLVQDGKKILVIDPTGEYAESFYEESVKQLTLGVDTTLDPGQVSFTQWATLFETNDSTQPAVLADAIRSLRLQKKRNLDEVLVKKGNSVVEITDKLNTLGDNDVSFNLKLLPNQIIEEAVQVANSIYVSNDFQFNNKQWLVQKVRYKLDNDKLLDFFSADLSKTDLLSELDDFIKNKTHSLYINTSIIGIGEAVGAMIIDLISNYMLNMKKKNDTAFVLFIDEVHRYAKDARSGGFQTGLTLIAREGRKKGIFMFLTSQNPNDVPEDLLGQIGTLLIHRLTHRRELEAVRNYVSERSYKQIPKLNQGEAILTSINLLKDLHLSVMKCTRKHSNRTINL